MIKTTGPALGEWVRFTHYYDKPTEAEMEARAEELEGEEGTIDPVRRENQDQPALVIGRTSVSAEAELNYTMDGDPYVQWDQSKRRTLYVLKRTYRGRRYLVALEDIQREVQTA